MALFYLLAVLFALIDRVTKILAINYLRDMNQSMILVHDWLKLTYAENLGIAFGVRFLPPQSLLLLTFAISAGVIVYVSRSKNRNPLFITAFALILSGGVGNLIDRVMLGHVVDFIHFDLYEGVLFGRYLSLWPIFNVADSCITIGACMLVFLYDRIFTPEEHKG
ncbi:MAG: signal peptidase II [Chlorobiaceae bacterium]|nr:signal peptidase II [Chlorobiaceae bacterium]NTW73412.1 signal peptidase II [Chlorobiaceae bacterium]